MTRRKSCPFCGTPKTKIRNEVRHVESGETTVGGYAYEERVSCYVICTGCGASSGRFDAAQTAVEFWNRRDNEKTNL